MANKKLDGTETEVTTAEFNRYFQENYPYISYTLSDKKVEKWLNQDVIKRVSLSKKADYFQDYLLANGLTDDVEMMAGGNIKTIEKKVAEVNELIENGNKNNVSVIDTSTTWQSPMKYKPFVYKNGVLYENYDELDLYLYSKKGEKKWKLVKNKYTKSGDGVDAQKEILNSVAKMYRKELKYYAEGGSIDNADENKLMVANNNKQLKHHTEELERALENAKHVPAWVVSLVARATQDLSDVTHYLDGTTQYKNGGSIEGKTNQEIADMYWQMSEDLEEEIQKDRGSETSGPNWERIEKLEEDMYKYYELSVEYQKLADAEKGFNKNNGDQFNYEIGGL